MSSIGCIHVDPTKKTVFLIKGRHFNVRSEGIYKHFANAVCSNTNNNEKCAGLYIYRIRDVKRNINLNTDSNVPG